MPKIKNSETREKKEASPPRNLKKSLQLLTYFIYISKTQQNSFQLLLNSFSRPLKGNSSPPNPRKLTSEVSSATRERKRQIEEIGTFETRSLPMAL